MSADDNTVVLVDGRCSLCKTTTLFAARRDRGDMLRFASQSSSIGEELLEGVDIDPGEQSIVVVRGEHTYVRSRAVLEVLRVLRWPWPLFYCFRVLPRFVRDAVYDWVARNRYDWFGKASKDFCDDGLQFQDKLL